MSYCPNGHGPKEGRYCPECGSELMTAPPSGDSLRIRSPEAHASVNPTFILPGATGGGGTPALVKCPRCGRRSPETDTFDCTGPCGRSNLCLRHFDEEYDLCKDCAAERRGVAQQEAARQAALVAEHDRWQGKAQRLAGDLARVEAQGKAQAAALKQVEAQVAAKTEALARAEAALAEWRGRGEKAEGQLAEIARKEREAEAARQAAIKRQQEEAEAARRRAAEAASQQPVWQRIGIELITIPAGEFLYGDDKRKVTLPEYWIAKTPVTNAQYKVFVDATGYRAPSHWSGGQIPGGQENHPVVYVDWNDAGNFCAWAGVRLPSEQEWEKAARGTDGREYPWGAWQPGRCNSHEANVGSTSPVDRFPDGASPYGVLDAAGNVWEWCADWYDASQQARVLRGGSFSNEAQDVRCAFRLRHGPEYRRHDLGFRVASPGL